MALAPPFDEGTARAKVKKAQDLWNTKNPASVAKAYTKDCIWRNRDTFLKGHAEIEAFLIKKWNKEINYRLRKELFAFGPDQIAVQFWYEYQDAHDGMKWKRCYGLEDWTFANDGRMRKRQMSGNDVEINESERWFKDDDDLKALSGWSARPQAVLRYDPQNESQISIMVANGESDDPRGSSRTDVGLRSNRPHVQPGSSGWSLMHHDK